MLKKRILSLISQRDANPVPQKNLSSIGQLPVPDGTSRTGFYSVLFILPHFYRKGNSILKETVAKKREALTSFSF